MKWYSYPAGLILLILMMLSSSPAQDRVIARRLPGFPFVSFAYRRVGVDSASGKNKMEWVFFNKTDSILSFTYRISSSSLDTVVGRLTLAPGEKKFAGWFFGGDTLNSVDCADAEFRNKR